VNEFAIGMGPAIWSKTKGETKYALRILPIGGYCAMEGEDEDTGDPRAFSRQKGWKKIVILIAGSAMNFLLGLIIVVCLYIGIDQVRAPVITQFANNFACEGEDGLMIGDRLLEIDGHKILIYDNVSLYLSRNDGKGVDLVVDRHGQEIVLNDLPMERIEYEFDGQKHVGFGLVFEEIETLNFWGRLRHGLVRTVDFVRTVWISLGDLVTGRVALSDMSGVIGVVDVVSEVGAMSPTVWDGILNVLYFMSLIAVNLAVMNMLPIPALDGGRVFFILLNGLIWLVCRKRIPEKYEGYVHTVVFVLLIVFMILIAFKDVWMIFR